MDNQSPARDRNNPNTIVTDLAIGIAILVASLAIYDLLRYLMPSHTYPRHAAANYPRANNYDHTPLHALPPPSPYPLSWLRSTLSYSERDTIRTHGLDVAFFIRFLATQAKIFLTLTVFTSVVLYPTYITADNRSLDPSHPAFTSGLEIASLSNLPDRSRRLWVTLFSEIVVVATILLFLYRDIIKYAKYRRKYRAAHHNPSNYAVIVQDVPSHLRTHAHVYAIFDKAFPSQVTRVHLVRDAQALLALKAKYIVAVDKRNHLLHSLSASNTTHTTTDSHATATPPAAPDPDPDPAPRLSNTPTQATTCHTLSNEPQPQPAPAKQPPTTTTTTTPSSSSSDPPRRPSNRPSFRCSDVSYWTERKQQLKSQIDAAEQSLDQTAPLTAAAIVVFRSKRTATLAATAPVWINATECSVSRVAEPRAVNWNRLQISPYTRRIREYTSFAVLTAMAIFWTIPATSIQALENLRQVANRFPGSFIEKFVENEDNKTFVNLLEGLLPPLILFIVLLVMPLLFRFIISFERIHSRVLVEAKTRNFLFFFYIMSNFFYVVVIGSVFEKLREILENPGQLVQLLSNSVPKQSTFLMKYVLINAFLGSSMMLLNTGRLLVRPFLRLGAKTPREKRNSDEIFSQYPFAKMYALSSMVSLISFVYVTIAPVICAVAALYYVIAYMCHKQLLLHSHRPQFEGGGFLFRDAWTSLLVGLYFHQLSMIGIFGLKLAPPQAILSILSFAGSIWFHYYCRKNFLFRAKHGSLIDQANADDETGLRDEIPSNFAELYLHPGLRPVNELQELELAGLPDNNEPKDHV